jgi:hypothetical protein
MCAQVLPECIMIRRSARADFPGHRLGRPEALAQDDCPQGSETSPRFAGLASTVGEVVRSHT